MKTKLTSRTTIVVGLTASLSLSAVLASIAGCTSSEDGSPPLDHADANADVAPDQGAPTDDDAGPADDDSGASDASAEASADAEPDAEDAQADAEPDADAAPVTGCAAFPQASFCDDFDADGALDASKTKWDFLEQSSQPVLTLSTARSVSAPKSLLTQIIDGSTPGAKFAKTITKANFTKATWEYDVFLENIGSTNGFFLDDFQFTDAGGTDSFGFRLVVNANAASLKEVKLEHNQGANGGPYVTEPAFAQGTVKLGQWHHFKQTIAFTFEGAGVDDDSVDYEIEIDGASVLKRTYPGITRAQAAFVRFAGMPFIFNKADSAGLKIFWDNQKVDIQ